jgi:ketosteroid isomerase-like protein
MTITANLSPLSASKAMYDHVSRGDWDRVAAFMADDFVIYEPSSLPYGGEWRGRDALQRLYAHVMAYWRDPAVEWMELVGGERHAVALLHFTVTAPDSGNRFSQHIAEVTTFDDDGQMQSMRIHYFDTGEMARKIAG